MIEYNYNLDFQLENEEKISLWIKKTIRNYGFSLGEISYNFVSDEDLWKINMEFLNHDFYTDIISFDYKMGKQLNGEIFISIDRVRENALSFSTAFEEELHRVIIHGILHFCGVKDGTEEEEELMRKAEDRALEELSGLM